MLEAIAHPGGAEISLLELVRELKGDPQVTIILPEDGPLKAMAVAAGAEVRVLPWPEALMRTGERTGGSGAGKVWRAARAALALPNLAARVARLLDEIDADVLVTNGVKSHIVGSIGRAAATRPLIWYLRDGLEGRPMTARALRWFRPRCRGAVTISRFVEAETRLLVSATLPTRVIYNLVDFSRFPATGPRTNLGKAPGELWFGLVGSITPLKGQDLFLQAARRVARELSAARFVIVGTNFYRTDASMSYEQSLHALANVPELRGKVKFIGQRSDMPNVFSHVDVLVQPNRGPEALGRTILEAMASGVAVISVDRWGPGELVQHQRTGLCVPVLDLEALIYAMLQLGRNPHMRATLAATAEQWVHRELDPQRTVDQFRDFLQQVAASAVNN